MSDVSIPMSDMARNVNVRLRVTGIKRALLRFLIAGLMIRLAARIGGFKVAMIDERTEFAEVGE